MSAITPGGTSQPIDSPTAPGAAPGAPGGGAAAPPALASDLFRGRAAFEAIAAGRTSLSQGARGDTVRAMQEALVRLDPQALPRFGADGSFGRETLQALLAFQRRSGLAATGKLDQATLLALDRALGAPARPPSGGHRVLVGAPPDVDTDGISDAVERLHGLDPTRPVTEAGIATNGWPVDGYVWYPYFDNKPAVAFHKFDEVFGTESSKDLGHAYFEAYASGEANLRRGIWVPKNEDGRQPGHVQESDFEQTAGVDLDGDKPISDRAYTLLRDTAAPQEARFALRDASGKELEIRPGDRLVPTYVENGEVKRAEVRSASATPAYFVPGTPKRVAGEVVWRIEGKDGKIRGAAGDRAESRTELLALKRGVKFDFLDEHGEPVEYDKRGGDKIVRTWKDGDRWRALERKSGPSGGFTLRTLDAEGKRVTATEELSAADGEARLRAAGDKVIWRVQTRAGALRGDGDVSQKWDMWWWGRCHNTAAIDTTGIPAPKQDVKVARGVDEAADEKLVLSWPENGRAVALVPKRDQEGAVTGYTLEGRELALAEAQALARAKNAQPAVLAPSGAIRPAEVVTVTREEAQTLTSHMDDGATEYKGGLGHRFYGLADRVTLADGTELEGRVVSVKTESGRTIPLQHREGFEWRDDNRGVLRGADIKRSERFAGVFQNAAWTESSMASINAGRSDRIASLVFVDAQGREQTIPAAQVKTFGQEEAYDLSPADLWKAATMIKDGKSLTIEKATGTQVWNYAVKSMATQRIEKSALPATVRAQDELPGALAGTTAPEGRVYFRTKVKYLENGEENEKDYYYWAKFDADGKITDYNYLVDDRFASAPDFFWQSHVKDPFTRRWEGESQVPGAGMREIQGIYCASVGALDRYAVGGVLTAEDLRARKPVRP